jgi:hypothetical protein
MDIIPTRKDREYERGYGWIFFGVIGGSFLIAWLLDTGHCDGLIKCLFP